MDFTGIRDGPSVINMSDTKPKPHQPDPKLPGTIVYAVWLQPFGKLPESWQKELVETHPKARKKAPVIYVGQTRLTAQQRFENHLNGHKASSAVRRHGRQLIVLDEWKPAFPFHVPDGLAKAAFFLARRSKGNPTAREAAVAELLRDAGFFVYSA